MKTMRTTAGLLILGAASLACSGRYEAGGMDAVAGNSAGGTQSVGGTAAGGAAAGSNSAVAGDAMVGFGGTNSAGTGMPVDEFGPQCVPSGAPVPLTGAFAKPAVVWSRLAMLIWGKPGPFPSPLPAATTYAWAGDLVTQGFADANETLGSAPGARLFVAQWLNLGVGLGEDPNFTAKYDVLLPSEMPALPVLLQTPLDDLGRRMGVFTEPPWLALHTTITSRGEAMLLNVLQQQVPPPPPSIVNPERDPSLPDREALQQMLANPVCAGCHQLMDPVGYALGHFAADGSFRTLDHDAPIDTTGQISFGPESVTFDGIKRFGAVVANRCQPNLALADGFLKVAINLAGFPQEQWEPLFAANVDRVRQAFIAGGRSYPALVKAFAQSPAVLRP